MGPGAVPPGVTQLERVKENHQVLVVWFGGPLLAQVRGLLAPWGCGRKPRAWSGYPRLCPWGCLAPDLLHFGTFVNRCSKKGGLGMWGETLQ